MEEILVKLTQTELCIVLKFLSAAAAADDEKPQDCLRAKWERKHLEAAISKLEKEYSP